MGGIVLRATFLLVPRWELYTLRYTCQEKIAISKSFSTLIHSVLSPTTHGNPAFQIVQRNTHVCRGPSAVSALNMLRAGPIHVVVTR